MNNENATNGSTIVKLLERVYETLQAKVPDLPAVFIRLDHGATMRGGLVWGHFAPLAWTVDGEPRHEIMIGSECLASGAAQTLQTLTHEAVHALAHARGIKDTSRQGRYHNKRFKALAEELGLEYLGTDEAGRIAPDKLLGFSHVTMTDAFKVENADTLALLEDEIRAWRGFGYREVGMTRATKHAYALWIDADDDAVDVQQMGVTKYERLARRLTEHVHFVSSATQATVEGYLAALGFKVLDARGERVKVFDRDYADELLELGGRYPELVEAAAEASWAAANAHLALALAG